MWSTSRLRAIGRRLLLLGVLGLLVIPMRGSAQEGFPGLPELPVNPPLTAWLGVAQTGMSETAKAEQFAEVPLSLAVVHVEQAQYRDPETNLQMTLFRNSAFFMSDAAAEHPYGHMPPFTVRTVAFGSVPAEATVRVSQRRDEYDLPIPISIETNDHLCQEPGCGRARTYLETVVDDSVWVRVIELKVDGVDLGITGRCQTVEPAPLSLTNPGFTATVTGSGPQALAQMIDNGWFAAARGGVLEGHMDLPEFSECLTAQGEDISPMVTGTVSGPGNSVRLHASGPVCVGPDGQSAPIPPGTDVEDACNVIPPRVPYPERPRDD